MEQFILNIVQRYELDVTVACYIEMDWVCMWERGLPEIILFVLAALMLILLLQLFILPIIYGPGIARRLVKYNRAKSQTLIGTRAADVFCDAWKEDVDYNKVYTEALSDITSNKIAGDVCKEYLMPLGLAGIHTDDHDTYKVRAIRNFRNRLVHRITAVLRWFHKQR